MTFLGLLNFLMAILPSSVYRVWELTQRCSFLHIQSCSNLGTQSWVQRASRMPSVSVNHSSRTVSFYPGNGQFIPLAFLSGQVHVPSRCRARWLKWHVKGQFCQKVRNCLRIALVRLQGLKQVEDCRNAERTLGTHWRQEKEIREEQPLCSASNWS